MSLLQDIWSAVTGIGKGMTKTFDEQFDPVFTQMYPFDMPKLPPVSTQSLALIQNEDGSDRCVSCLACEKVCPSQVITIERKKNPAGKGFVLERFDIDLVNCMYCAACVESCPASAIVTIQDFEMSTPNLQTLKADKEFLDLQGLRAQQWYSPKIGVEYRENVTTENLHGAIVKAPLEEQPGGLAALEKIKAEGGELPVSSVRAPAFAMSELPVAVYEDFVHEPVGRALAPVASSVAPASSEPAPVVAAPAPSSAAPAADAVAVPAAGGAPRSKKIKRWGEPKTDDESETSSAAAPAPSVGAQGPAPTPAVAEAPKVEASSPAVSSEPAPSASASSDPAPSASASSDPAPASSDAPAPDAKPRSPKIKRWEPKN